MVAELTVAFTGRQSLRDRGTYFVVREAHKNESDQQIKDAIERLVGLLQGDEGHESRTDQIEHLVSKGAQGTATPAADDEMDVVEV